MASTNRYQGLHRGPIDHNASSVINAVSNGAVGMGSVVEVDTTIPSTELLPRVSSGVGLGGDNVYGIAVGGDTDGIYGDGSAAADDANRATNAAGQGIVIVTQGRCPARVGGAVGGTVIIGDQLTMSAVAGVLQKVSAADQRVIAIALNGVDAADTDIIAVDVQREGGAHAV